MHGGRSFEGISPEQTNPKFASPERPMSYKWAAVTVLWDALSMKRGRVMMTVKKMNVQMKSLCSRDPREAAREGLKGKMTSVVQILYTVHPQEESCLCVPHLSFH